MTARVPEPAFWTDDSSVCETMAHGEGIAPHFHDYGQLRYAASGALVTTTKVGTWVAPANRITWVPPFYVHSSHSYGETDVRVLPVPAALSEELPPEPSVFVASPLLREAYLAMSSEHEPAGSERGRLLLAVIGAELARAPQEP